MSPKQGKQLYFWFFYIILAPIGFDQEAEAEVDTRQLWIWKAVSSNQV